tara:strand:- start:1244 stop:1828 length:585 start_codon:yes stop_codon:yes gene_type:complete
MKALIGLTLKKAKEVAKQELGVKRMGDARFKMILDQGVKSGDFILDGDMIKDPSEDDPLDLFGEVEIEEDVSPDPVISTKTVHPKVAHLDPKLSSSDLPRAGDLYHYRSYSGEVVQGEVKSTICFAECQNPDGTWQTVAFQDLYLKKRGVPRETMLNHLNAYYQNNNKLRSERDQLLKEIRELEEKINGAKGEA